VKNYGKYLLYRYKENARGEDNFIDCYGLFLMIQREEFGKILPDFNSYESSPVSRNQTLSSSLFNYPARRAYIDMEGYGVVIESGGVDSHIGVCIGDNKIIHCTEKRGVIIEDILEPHLRGRIKYYEILPV
jgi:cell wall-associated NlpC family hydrolase